MASKNRQGSMGREGSSHSRYPFLDLSFSAAAQDAAVVRRLFRQCFVPVLLQESPDILFEMMDRIMIHGVSREAFSLMEKDPKLAKILSGALAGIPDERQDSVRIACGRILNRAGYFLLGMKIIRRVQLRTVADHSYLGVLKLAFGDIGFAHQEFKRAHELGPDDPAVQASYLFSQAFHDASALPEALRGFEALCKKHPELDIEGFLSMRWAACLRLAGRNSEALAIIDRAIARFPGATGPTQKSGGLVIGTLLHERASILARLGRAQEARAVFDETTSLVLASDLSYPNRIWLLKRIEEAGLARPAELNLLRLTSALIPESDPFGRYRSPFGSTFAGAKAENGLSIDFGRNEYRLPGSDRPSYGIPLEIRLIGLVAVVSAAYSDLPGRRGGAVPRSFVIDLLWPDIPAPISALEARLSKLLLRAEEVHGFQLRDKEEGGIFFEPLKSQGLTVLHSPQLQAPSYLETALDPSTSGVAAWYNLSTRHARRLVSELQLKGLWPRERAQARRKREAA